MPMPLEHAPRAKWPKAKSQTLYKANLLVFYPLVAGVLFAPTREVGAASDQQVARVRTASGRPHIQNDGLMFDVA